MTTTSTNRSMHPALFLALAALIVFSQTGAAATQPIQRELLPRTLDAAPVEDNQPAIASSGDGYLAAWLAHGVRRELRVARLSATGELLDPVGIRLAVDSVTSPSIVWNGEYYLVAWSDYSGAFAMRVTEEGRLLDASPVRIGETWLAAPPVWNGTNFLVLTAGGSSPLRGQLFDRNLRPAGEPFEASQALGVAHSHSVRFDGLNFVIVFQAIFENRHQLFTTIISSNGRKLIDWKRTAVDATMPEIGAIGDRSLAGWSADGGIVVAEIDRSGRLGAQRFFAGLSSIVRISEEPGGGAALVVSQVDALKLLRLSRDLQPIGAASALADMWFAPVIHADGSGAAIWATFPPPPEYGLSSIRFALIPRDVPINPQGGTLVSRGPSWQQSPRLAFDGSVYVAALAERANDAHLTDVVVTRMNADGESLDSGMRLFRSISDPRPRIGLAAADGLTLVLWSGDQIYPDRRAVFGVRMRSDGSFVDGEPFAIASSSCDVSLSSAASKSHFLTLREDCATAQLDVVATPRVGQESVSRQLFTYAMRHGADIACGTSECLVAVAQNYGELGWRVDLQRVSLDGIPIGVSFRGADHAMAPTVASDGARFLVAYTDTETQQVRSFVVNGGDVGEVSTLSDDAGYEADATWTGRDYAVVWRRLYQSPATLFLRRVGSDGTPLAPAIVATSSANAEDEVAPSRHAVASRGGGDLLLLWTRDPLTLDVSSPRIWMSLHSAARVRPVRR